MSSRLRSALATTIRLLLVLMVALATFGWAGDQFTTAQYFSANVFAFVGIYLCNL